MKDEIINNYLEFRREKQESLGKRIRYTFKRYGIALIAVIITWIIAVVLINMKSLPNWADLIAIGIVGLVELISFSLIQRRDMKFSGEDIRSLQAYYIGVEEWLATIGYKNKVQIERLHDRYQEELKKINNQKANNQNIIDKLMGFFVIPVYVALISSVLDANVDFGIKVDSITKLIIIMLAIYFVFVAALKMTEPIIYDSFNATVMLIKDLEGVLDIRFLSEPRKTTHGNIKL